MDYQHYNSFNLTDPRTGKTKNLTDDFGGIIINTSDETYERECMPQMSFITDKNDTRDGEIFIKANYGVRVIDMVCFFSEELGGGDLFELKRWLGKQYQQIFSWDGDDEEKAIFAILSNKLDSQVYYQKKFYGKLNLTFTCHNPYYFVNKKEDIPFNNMTVGISKNIRCAGNVDSYPLLKITPSTTSISFNWNGLIVTLNNLTTGTTYYLDCEKCQCYYMVNNIKTLCSDKFQSTKFIDYPSIDCNTTNNLVVLNGSFSININPRTRII